MPHQESCAFAQQLKPLIPTCPYSLLGKGHYIATAGETLLEIHPLQSFWIVFYHTMLLSSGKSKKISLKHPIGNKAWSQQSETKEQQDLKIIIRRSWKDRKHLIKSKWGRYKTEHMLILIHSGQLSQTLYSPPSFLAKMLL